MKFLFLMLLTITANAQTQRAFEKDTPTGMVSAFALQSCPNGWVQADGSTPLRSTYPRLFAAMGTIHGTGNGTTTFHLPDYRGRFLRGVSGVSTADPDSDSRTAMNTGGNVGNNVGSIQGHSFQTHTHIQNSHNHDVPGRPEGATANSGRFLVPSTGGAVTTVASNNATATNQNATASGTTAQATANETRPVNAYVIFCIKI
jgi:microcystin-dependent protein